MALKRIGAGKRMSGAVIHGDKVYLAGVTPDAALGKSVAEQTKDVLAQIDATLKEAGSDKTNIIKANIWLTEATAGAGAGAGAGRGKRTEEEMAARKAARQAKRRAEKAADRRANKKSGL